MTKRFVSLAVTGLLILAVMWFPFVWILRDGLGPDSVESTGLMAVRKALLTFYWGPTVLGLVAVKLALMRWVRSGNQGTHDAGDRTG